MTGHHELLAAAALGVAWLVVIGGFLAVWTSEAMSRLDAEYDPAEHHDLDRIERSIPDNVTGAVTFCPVCACGWTPPGSSTTAGPYKTRDGAYKAWDHHRHQEWFG